MSDIASETHVQRNKIAAKPGRKPKEVWKFFTPIGQKKDGHQSCKCNYCPWSQTHGEPSSMEAHLALSCHKAPIDIKEKFLLIIKSRGFDGWTSPLGQSLYAFIIITPDRKEIIHSIKNFSANSHIANFLADEINEVITSVGVENFAAIVSDHAFACAAAKKIIAERYKHILPIRCIAHHVNLISTDICKTTFAKDIISKCQKIVKYFKQFHQAGEELREKITNEISGGRLKNYVVTRWTTAWDCTNSILRLEQTLKNILDETPEKLSAEVTKLIQSRSFFIDVEAVNTLLGPVKSVVKSLAFKTTLLSDCFVELIKLSQKIKLLPPVSDYDFKHKCIELFNKHWQEFDINLYLLAYLLHPNYRGKGLLPTVFRNIYLLAIKIWVNMGGGETSSAKLISQIRSFYLRDIEFDYPFSNNEDVITWWRMCNPVPDEENHIQKLALKILFITPHNARCERVFSILGWFTNKRRTKLKVEKLEAMAKLHIHYIMNA
ncbi:hypothetical protein RirG_183590 [Rhizophagus irregularis DAOM 197198w]|uniref:DUF659 domain-containing protein n=2 Tax=Rhizophagus irregularis TaxID=588596 RepID=A0A015JY74_RHIIW|nr:hypothetical protein RirG_183590 [Rhizophagus irregularis DAOM 197198w]